VRDSVMCESCTNHCGELQLHSISVTVAMFFLWFLFFCSLYKVPCPSRRLICCFLFLCLVRPLPTPRGPSLSALFIESALLSVGYGRCPVIRAQNR
jgi:hypothetical protein